MGLQASVVGVAVGTWVLPECEHVWSETAEVCEKCGVTRLELVTGDV